MKYYLAIDLGASSGRHIISYKENGNLILEEMYRFKNSVSKEDNHLVWDIEKLFQEVKNGIKKCLEKYPNIESLSIDTWGVDYVLMNKDQEILPCYAYRDNRTNISINKVHEKISFKRLYEITGSQFQKFTSIYQLYADKLAGRLDKADSFLMIPEYLMYKLTGNKIKEFTNAGTTGLYDINTLQVSQEIMDKLGFNDYIKEKVYPPKTLVGYLKEDIQKEVGGNVKVVLCATHDTASAVEGITMKNNAPYISSGTWSLLGIKSKKAINSEKARLANYSNEFGPNYIRVQKNIMGLWIIQCVSKAINMEFKDMVQLAKSSTYQEIFDVNDERFLSPEDMIKEIINYFKEKNMKLPQNNADIICSIYHSLAYSYKVALQELEDITNESYDELYIVGGGAKNDFLNELTQQYTNKKVIALPIEATAIGNLKIQMEE